MEKGPFITFFPGGNISILETFPMMDMFVKWPQCAWLKWMIVPKISAMFGTNGWLCWKFCHSLGKMVLLAQKCQQIGQTSQKGEQNDKSWQKNVNKIIRIVVEVKIVTPSFEKMSIGNSI